MDQISFPFLKAIGRRFFRCPAAVAVHHFQKLLSLKFELPPQYTVRRTILRNPGNMRMILMDSIFFSRRVGGDPLPGRKACFRFPADGRRLQNRLDSGRSRVSQENVNVLCSCLAIYPSLSVEAFSKPTKLMHF